VEPRTRLEGKRILLGVSGSIAAYKAVELLRRLREQGADVRVVLTRNAERFVTSLTFETLSGNPVPGAEFQDREQPGIGHIDLTSGLDLAVIAPATANVIGKVASGIADDTLTTALTAVECPVVMAPAMNDRMYRNAVVRRNIALLRAQGIRFVEPGTGELACGTVGQGRLADVDLILREIAAALPPGDLAGIKIVVTAGPTRERIDAVRFISNPSTGRMGFALAAAAYGRGADVVLISGPTEVIPPRGPVLIRVTSAAEMLQAVLEHRTRADVLIMAAAVSDFKPARSSERKIKKQEAATMLELARTEDILATVGRLPGRPLLVGFAAETDDLLDNAQKKMKEKDIDLIVANDLSKQGAGFAVDTNSVTLIERSGGMTEIPLMPKAEIAARIMDKIVELKKR